MHAKELIQFALTASNAAVLGTIDKLSDAPTTFPAPNGGCHPLWVLGHLTVIEGMIPAVIFGDQNAAADWEKHFGRGSQTVGNAAAYPSFTEVRKKYLELRERNLKLLDSLSEEDLDQPVKAPPKGLEQLFATVGLTFLSLATHQMMHYGHATDALRAAGRTGAAAQAA